MLLFTNRARQVIDTAIGQLPDERSRQVWVAWVKENPQLRRPGGITQDHEPTPDQSVILVVVSALESLQASMRDRINRAQSEDEVSDLENDLTYVAGLAQVWQRIPAH